MKNRKNKLVQNFEAKDITRYKKGQFNTGKFWKVRS